MRIFKAACVACGIALTLAWPCWAQESYPNRPVTIVVPVSAGSIADAFARILAEQLGNVWKQQVIVVNRPGVAGSASVANSEPNGYTLLLTTNGLVVGKLISKEVPFEPTKDFIGVTKIGSVPQLLAIPPELPVKTLADFIALAKEKPGQLNFSSSGINTTNFLCFELLKQSAAINVVHVPYKGGGEAFTAVIRNDVQMTLSPIPLVKQMAASNKVRVIAINDDSRNAQMPDVPTIAETVPGYKCDSWFAMFAPASTPRPIVKKVSEDIAKVLKLSSVIENLQTYGAVPSPTSPEELDNQFKAEEALYAKVLRAAGVIK